MIGLSPEKFSQWKQSGQVRGRLQLAVQLGCSAGGTSEQAPALAPDGPPLALIEQNSLQNKYFAAKISLAKAEI